MTKKNVEHGRIIGKGHSVEYFEHMQHWVSFVRNKYSLGMLTEDKHGRKLFCNFDQKTLEVSDGRIETKTTTKILCSRIKEYISESSEDLTEEHIDYFVSQFKSHSWKRSITTHAAEMGATDTELTKQFYWTNNRTMQEYMDTSEFKNSLNHKLKL
jgi:hypothetical protein